ncbi:hypothetical protein [Actinomadura terrae]|uniref:hypothetical protein n=1 Tax=Actinomadura terrae TaxID=604353 RepID=UPI001FA71944|nr:hypothetical protein [Actinomadura terrae]
MIRNSRRVAVLAVAGAVAIAPVLSGCGAGSEPQTAAPTQLTEGVNATVPKNEPEAAQIDIRNMFLLGPKPDMTFGQGSALPLYATIINQVKGRQDRLLSVSSSAFGQQRITGGSVVLPPAQPSGQGSAVQLVGQAPAASPTPEGTKKPGKKKPKPGSTPTGGASAEPGASTEPGATAEPGGSPGPGTPTGTGASSSPGAAASASGTPTGPENTIAPTAEPTVQVPPGGKAPLVVLINPSRPLIGGERVTLRLRFEQAGVIDVAVPVIPQQGEYAQYTAVSEGTPAPGAAVPAHPSEGATSGAPATPGGESPGTGATPGTGEGATPGATTSPGGEGGSTAGPEGGH